MGFQSGHTHYDHPNCKKTQFKAGEAHHTTPHTEETKRKVSLARRGKATGLANASWKGGTTPLMNKIRRLPEYKEWQKAVYVRDNWTCRKCAKRGGELTPHHITALSWIVKECEIDCVEAAAKTPQLWDVDNGVTLCWSCHETTPNYSSKAVIQPVDTTDYKPVSVNN